jgi:hypothetical protein
MSALRRFADATRTSTLSPSRANSGLAAERIRGGNLATPISSAIGYLTQLNGGPLNSKQLSGKHLRRSCASDETRA